MPLNTLWNSAHNEQSWRKLASQNPVDRWKAALAMPRDGIRVGENLQTGAGVHLSPKEHLSTHLQVIGPTGVGKSYFLECILKRLASIDKVFNPPGFCLISPHADICERMLDYLAFLHMQRPELEIAKRVIPFNIAESRYILGFNPVARNARIPTYQVVALMEAIRKGWGQANFQETPRLARWLFNCAFALVDAQATLLQAYHMVQPSPNAIRTAITRRISDPIIRNEWEWFDHFKYDREREERTESSLNRLKPFIGNERIKQIIGQSACTIDFPSILAEGKILLINLDLQSTISMDDQALLGTLIVNELLSAAFARPRHARRPFYLCIDEAQRFVTKDICEVLEGGRKFALHQVLCHQQLSQFRLKDPEVYYSLLANARAKVVFGGLEDEDAEIFAKRFGSVNLKEVKDEVWRSIYVPHESTRLVVTESGMEGGGRSHATVNHQSIASGTVFIPGSDLWPSVETPQSASASEASGSSETDGDTSSWSHSRSESLVPWYEYHREEELSSRTFYSLEEQLYKRKMQLIEQPRQHATLLIPDNRVIYFKTAGLRDFHVPNSVREEFKQECFQSAGFFKSPQEIKHEIAALEERLLLPETITATTTPAPEGDAPKAEPSATAPAPDEAPPTPASDAEDDDEIYYT